MANPFSNVAQLQAWAERAAKYGLTPSDLQNQIDDPGLMNGMVLTTKRMAPIASIPGIGLDLSEVLCLGTPFSGNLKTEDQGPMLVRYGGWSLSELIESDANRDLGLLSKSCPYRESEWFDRQYPSGICSFELGSFKDESGQYNSQRKAMRRPLQFEVPTVIVASVLMAYYKLYKQPLHQCKSFRCLEKGMNDKSHVCLTPHFDAIEVNGIADSACHGYLHMARCGEMYSDSEFQELANLE